MHEIESNKHAWGQLSKDHYETFKQALQNGTHRFNPYITQELGDLSGKRIIHLQCNTGADTVLLARKAKSVVGVDLVPDNVLYARKLAEDLGVANVSFIACDLMEFQAAHNETYDMVFVSEGAIGWLPDLGRWGSTVRHLLKDDGCLYLFDSHPFFLMFNTDQLGKGRLEIEYPYFSKAPDLDNTIGGYASPAKDNVEAYFWMYTVSEVLSSLTSVGMHIEYFHEFAENFFDAGGMKPLGNGLYNFDCNTNKLPMSFSIKATVCR